MRFPLIAAALALLSVTPAAAQYDPYGGYGPGPRYGRPFDPDEDRPRRRYGPPQDYGRPYGPPRGYDRPRARFGSVCVTSRGSCPTRPAPHNTPCGCQIPGFGYKRGAVY